MHEEGTRRFPDDYTALELRAITTRALAAGDDFSRALLRQQLEAEEFTESPWGMAAWWC